MIRVFWFFLLVGLLAAGAAWLADRPGDLVLNWLGYRIEVSMMTAAALLLILVGASMFLWSLTTGLFAAPGAVTGVLRARRKDKGYTALSQGMIAVSAGNAREAAKFSAQANKVLGDQPLALLLKAQTAQLRGDKASARRAFEAMLKSPETQSLGLRGLFVEAQRQDDSEAALAFARRALIENRDTEWAASALFDMQSAAGDWDEALDTLATNLRHKLIDKTTAQRWRAVLLTGQAMRVEESDPDSALQLALEAHGLAPDLVPASVIAGRLLGHQGQMRRATKILEQAWRTAPHPEIAEAYANARPGDSVRDRLQRVTSLAARTPGHPTAALAVAEAAIDALDWKAAREALEPHLEDRPSQHMCTLMAEIEEGEHGDRGRSREWLSRAVRAPRDPAWTADGIVSSIWAPVSPVTGRIDAFEWKQPVERLGSYEGEEFDDDILDTAPIEEMPADEAETVDVTEEPPADAPCTTTDAEPDRSADGKSTSSAAAEPATGAPAAAKNKNAIPRLPDDPGPDAQIDEDAPYKTR